MVLNVTSMQAITWNGTPFQVDISTLPIPNIISSTDALVKVDLAGICTADIHTYNGEFKEKEVPWVMGHEALGVVVDVGDSVTSFSTDDKVIILDQILEDYPAEYVRVPFADDNLLAVPQSQHLDSTQNSSDDIALDYLLASSVFPAGWGALDLAGYQPGDSVAVFGAGPIGLMAVYSAILQGSSRVYLLDSDRRRLSVGEGMGAMPIDFTQSDPVSRVRRQEAAGILRVVDCIGIESTIETRASLEDKILEYMMGIVAENGSIGRVAVAKPMNQSVGISIWRAFIPTFQFSLSGIFEEGPQVQSGVVDPALLAPRLIEMVSKRLARPSFIVSSLISVEETPQFYQRASRNLETKVVLKIGV
ncbi:GroES-like protein [Penicillium macrosclerotiorum]|uniref:GroES-like protein n=1 Tax=Penicillium macrosclerotiorum TaxID=303699 RepID=UPI002547B793|nr:GroES-like protein [Penicillium macrosclerotiorum]KAJ5691962.1 GroES-like protein [Penicillium macrosclerotiorum]